MADSCPAFPPGFSARTYDATWTAGNDPTLGSLTLAGRFAGDYSYVVTRTGLDRGWFEFYKPLNDVDEQITEQIGELGYYGVYGSGLTLLDSNQAVVDMAFNGSVEYCTEARPGSNSTSCAVGRIYCSSAAHRLRLERQF